jgi:hypothetical protein
VLFLSFIVVEIEEDFFVVDVALMFPGIVRNQGHEQHRTCSTRVHQRFKDELDYDQSRCSEPVLVCTGKIVGSHLHTQWKDWLPAALVKEPLRTNQDVVVFHPEHRLTSKSAPR